MSDIEAMLNEAEHNAKVQAVKDLPTLPFAHEDCVEFDKCLNRCGELAKKNGWLFYAEIVPALNGREEGASDD